MFQTFILHNGFYDYILTPDCFDAFGIGGLIGYLYKEDKLAILKKYIKIALPFALLFFFYWKIANSGGHAQYFRRFFDSIISAGMILFCISKSFISVIYSITLFHFCMHS